MTSCKKVGVCVKERERESRVRAVLIDNVEDIGYVTSCKKAESVCERECERANCVCR